MHQIFGVFYEELRITFDGLEDGLEEFLCIVSDRAYSLHYGAERAVRLMNLGGAVYAWHVECGRIQLIILVFGNFVFLFQAFKKVLQFLLDRAGRVSF